jgi:predicted nucleotidyltransferase
MKTLDLPNQNKLVDVMRQNQIEFAALFGSHAKGIEKKDSDYDILIEFSPDAEVGLFEYQTIENEISSTLGKKVDLVTVDGIDKYIKDEVFRTMKVIYDNRPKR